MNVDRLLKLITLIALPFSGIEVTQADTVKIYAAASLSNALNEVSKNYQKNNPNTQIIAVYGASSMLAKQIRSGAKADLYFSADQDWMNYLIKQKKIEKDQTKLFLFNEIVVISPKHIKASFKASTDFNFAGSFKGHLCTGQMESVPIGKYAKQSLTYFNWLGALKGRIVGTDDVRSALAFVERGECTRGIVYKTDALSSKKVKILGVLAHNSHQPVIYPIALTKQGQADVKAIKFYRYIRTSDKSKEIFKKYGFKY